MNIGEVCGAYMNAASVHANGTPIFSRPMICNYVNENEVEISGIFNIRDVYDGRTGVGTVSTNTVTITSVTIGQDVYGGYILNDGTATVNTVNLTDVDVTRDAYGARIGRDGLASNNTVTINNNVIVGDNAGNTGGCWFWRWWKCLWRIIVGS